MNEVQEQMPKTLPCAKCGAKPKRQIVGWGYSDKDDEFFLVHRCRGVEVRFPEKGRFYDRAPSSQILPTIKAWNEEHGQKEPSR